MTQQKSKVLIMEPIDDMEDTHQMLKDAGYELILGPPVSRTAERFSESQLIELCQDVDAIMGMAREKITRKVIESSPRLRVICKYGIGVDNIDIQAASEHGVLVTNAPVHTKTVAEYAFSLILSVLKKIPRNLNHLKQGKWRDSSTMGNELYKKTIGMVGFGAIGKQLAKRLQGWDVQILIYDPFATRETADLFGAQLVDWNTLFQTSDVVTLHLPLMESTRKIISRNEFFMMKNSAILINTSRGPIVDEQALIEALQDKRIAGAGLDVFETEPISKDNPLLEMENVVITPHVAGYTFESLHRISEQCSRNCLSALRGEIPEFIVNREAVEKWRERVNLIK
ncbi:hydroxyacid dehydrogenase [Ammoniphilus resinae]|uniref:D-3-phosphoglycerate dehydrogenase n=1 Tax=Ammoniphilus resinae TaxID=861532 RepID=A0ABS4GPX1_9BACL|nr:hydroxyacid dehydrogenase [Ammoniphilus resinae]MBP1932172.1 D-3-phosphoglycerate dehydrogenase [Ammoniphilus resinae]